MSMFTSVTGPGTAVLLLVGASVSTAQPIPLPTAPALAGQVHSRGVRVLQPGQSAGAQDGVSATPAVNTGTESLGGGLSPVSNPPPRPVIQLCARPFARVDLTLSGAGGFDRALTQELKTHKRVVVDLDRPYPDRDQPPAALSPWLSQAKAAGGEVTVKQYCKAARSMLSSWLAKLVEHVTGVSYRSARGYDVVLYADALDRKITQVEFQPRAAVADGSAPSSATTAR